MGKNSKKHGNRPSANDTFQYAQRALEKQDFKEALKNAKVCFRQDPRPNIAKSSSGRWLARGLQLARAGLQTEGRAAAQELLAMGVSRSGRAAGVARVAAGSRAVRSSGGRRQDLRAVDRRPIRPFWPVPPIGRWPTRHRRRPRLREFARERRWFARPWTHCSAGDENAALAALGDVPRNSPFAEWKLFVRGLAAYYRHEDEAMRANWDRLAADRFAARLAAPLRRLADPACGAWRRRLGRSNDEEFRQAIRVLEKDLLRRTDGLVSRVLAKQRAGRSLARGRIWRPPLEEGIPAGPARSGATARSPVLRHGGAKGESQLAERSDDCHRSAALGSALEPGQGVDRREGGRGRSNRSRSFG